MLGADGLEHAGVGGEARLAPPFLRQPELGEQHLGQLLGRADGELLAGQHPHVALQRVGLLLHSLGDRPDRVDVELHPRALHLHQHVDQRQLDLVQEAGEAVRLQALALALGQDPGYHRLGGHPIAVAFHLDTYAFVAGQLLQRIAPPGGVDQVGGQHGVVLELDVAFEAFRGSDVFQS